MNVKRKSDEYLQASQLLKDRDVSYCCSIALAYYSVFIYMRFLLAHIKKDSVSYSDSEFKGDDAHKKVREKVMEQLNRIKPDDWRDLNKRIFEFHDIRVEADYKDTIFNKDDAIKWHEEAVYLRRKLKYFYNNLLEDAYK